MKLEAKPFQDILIGKKISLVRADPSFAYEHWESILRDREQRHSSWEWLESAAQLAEYFRENYLNPPEKEIIYLIRIDHQIIGSFHVHNINYDNHKTEIGYGIEKNFEDKGYVSEAVKLIEQELRRLEFNKVEIICNTENLRSVKLAEKNGYNREGTRYQDFLEHGKFRDSAIFGKILSL